MTRLVHSYCVGSLKPLEAVSAMRAGKRWKDKRLECLRADGSEMDDAEVADLRRERGDVASARGTLLHYHAEAWCNGRCIEGPWSPEFKMILLLAGALQELGFAPWRTEVAILSAGLCCAGTLDALLRNEEGELALIDWKRCRDVSFERCFRALLPPLDHLPDCNGWLYALQLNTYRFILECEYGYAVGGNMYLAIVHPGLAKPRLVRVPLLQEEMEMLVEDQVSRGLALCAARPGPDAPFELPTARPRC